MDLPALTARFKRETRVDDDDGGGNGSSKKPRGGSGGPAGSDILSDVAIQKALKRAGYTIPDEVEGLESLLPVRVSFP